MGFFLQIGLQFEVLVLSLSLKDLVLTPNLAELSSLFISETHTETNISKSWGLRNLLHDCCREVICFVPFIGSWKTAVFPHLPKKFG